MLRLYGCFTHVSIAQDAESLVAEVATAWAEKMGPNAIVRYQHSRTRRGVLGVLQLFPRRPSLMGHVRQTVSVQRSVGIKDLAEKSHFISSKRIRCKLRLTRAGIEPCRPIPDWLFAGTLEAFINGANNGTMRPSFKSVLDKRSPQVCKVPAMREVDQLEKSHYCKRHALRISIV